MSAAVWLSRISDASVNTSIGDWKISCPIQLRNKSDIVFNTPSQPHFWENWINQPSFGKSSWPGDKPKGLWCIWSRNNLNVSSVSHFSSWSSSFLGSIESFPLLANASTNTSLEHFSASHLAACSGFQDSPSHSLQDGKRKATSSLVITVKSAWESL